MIVRYFKLEKDKLAKVGPIYISTFMLEGHRKDWAHVDERLTTNDTLLLPYNVEYDAIYNMPIYIRATTKPLTYKYIKTFVEEID